MRRHKIASLTIATTILALAILYSSVMQPTQTNSTHYTTTTQTPIVISTFPQLLSTSGTRIIDGQGNVILLRGVDVDGYAYKYSWATGALQPTDFDRIASWGFNVIRLEIAWDYIEPSPGHYNDSYLQNTVDQNIEWAERAGVYIILDLHQNCWSSYFTTCNGAASDGLPPWAVSAYTNTDSGRSQAMVSFWEGLGPNGTAVTESNPSMQDRLAMVWRHTAERYGNNAVIAGYDLFNEPLAYPELFLPHFPNFESVMLPQFYREVVDSIRTVDPSHICVWEGANSSLNRPNTVYSPHYPGVVSGSANQLSEYTGREALASDIERYVNQTVAWNVPMYIGEWAELSTATAVQQYIPDVLSILDHYQISSTWFTYGPTSFASGLLDQDRQQRTTLVQNLVRPYVRGSSSPEFTVMYDPAMRTLNLQLPAKTTVVVAIPRNYSIKAYTPGVQVVVYAGVMQITTGEGVSFQVEFA
jgi:endoglycosylceramidase